MLQAKKRYTKGQLSREDDCNLPVYHYLLVYGRIGNGLTASGEVNGKVENTYTSLPSVKTWPTAISTTGKLTR